MSQAHRSKTFSGRSVLPVAACEGGLSCPEQKTGGTGKPAPRGPYVTRSLRSSGSFYSVSPGGSSSPAAADSGAGVGRPSRHAEIPACAPGCTADDSLDLRAGETLPAFSAGGLPVPDFLGGLDPLAFRKRDRHAFYQGCAAAGLTMTQTARLGGISFNAVKEYARAHDLRFYTVTPPTGLDDAVLALHRDGVTCKDAAARLGVSRIRVRRISKRLNLRWRGVRDVVEKPKVAKKKVGAQTLRRALMAEAYAKLTEKERADFDWLVSSWQYRHLAAFDGVGRRDLLAWIEDRMMKAGMVEAGIVEAGA